MARFFSDEEELALARLYGTEADATIARLRLALLDASDALERSRGWRLALLDASDALERSRGWPDGFISKSDRQDAEADIVAARDAARRAAGWEGGEREPSKFVVSHTTQPFATREEAIAFANALIYHNANIGPVRVGRVEAVVRPRKAAEE